MKTYIIDNGGIYSNHALYFVESSLNPKAMAELLARHPKYFSEFYVAGFVDDLISWAKPLYVDAESSMKLKDFLQRRLDWIYREENESEYQALEQEIKALGDK